MTNEPSDRSRNRHSSFASDRTNWLKPGGVGDRKVAVVGCGISGLYCALRLARSGRFHSVELFERSDRLEPVGAGFLIQASGQAVLERVGLLEPVRSLGAPVRELVASHVDGRTLCRLRLARPGHDEHAIGAHRGDVFQTLYDAARDAGVDFHLNATAVGWRDEPDGRAVRLTFDDGRELGPFELVVAADGARSRLRSAITPPAPVKRYSFSVMWFVGRTSTTSDRLSQTVVGTKRLLGLLPLGSNRRGLFWGLKPGERSTVEKAGVSAWKDQVRAVGGRFKETEEILADCDDFSQCRFAEYFGFRTSRPNQGRVIFVGDAAHSMTPHLGQGANLALIDGKTLCDEILSRDDIVTAGAAYARRRRGQVAYYARLSGLLNPFFQSDVPGLAIARDLVLPWLPSVPLVGVEMRRTVAGYKRGWFGGSIDLDQTDLG